MSTLNIELHDELARASEEVAERLGVSRSELIRRALARELDMIRSTQERTAGQSAVDVYWVIAQLTDVETSEVLHRLQRLLSALPG
jgi:metal-responsive CopG/Arc/MetJ family transcriptional regulator